MSSSAFRALLQAGDVPGLMAAWGEVAPHLPQPKTYAHAEIAMHMARTSAKLITLKARAYSHRWLTERDLPSQLPDDLRPSAERLYPVVVDAVGISVNTRSPLLKPAFLEVRGAMEHAVEDCYALGDKDPLIVRPRMDAARDKTMKSLFGRWRP